MMIKVSSWRNRSLALASSTPPGLGWVDGGSAMLAAPSGASLQMNMETLKRRATAKSHLPGYMKPTHTPGSYAAHHKKRRRPVVAHDEESARRKKAPFMDEKQLERSLNLGVERMFAMTRYDGYGMYDAICKAVEEVNFKASRDGNLASIDPLQIAGWFDMLMEGRDERRRRSKGRSSSKKKKAASASRRGGAPQPGSALETYVRVTEEKTRVEAPPRVAYRSTEIREAMRQQLRAWRQQVIDTRDQLAREAQALKEEMGRQNAKMAGGRSGKAEEQRYYKWVCFSAWKLEHRRSRIEKRRAARRKKFQGAISKALSASSLTAPLPNIAGLNFAALNGGAEKGAAAVWNKIKMRGDGDQNRLSKFMNVVVGAVRESSNDTNKFQRAARAARKHRQSIDEDDDDEDDDDDDDDDDDETLGTFASSVSKDSSVRRAEGSVLGVAAADLRRSTRRSYRPKPPEGLPPVHGAVPHFLRKGRQVKDPGKPVIPPPASAVSLLNATASTSGQEKGDSTSLKCECFARAF